MQLFIRNMHANIEIQIKDYFYSNPSDRLAYYKYLGAQLIAVDSVILVLDWGADSAVEDSWGGAVDLLSEAGEVLLQIVESKELAQWKSGGFCLEVRLHRAIAMLAEGIAVAGKIPAHLRLAGTLSCWTEFNKYSSHERDKHKTKIVSAIIRAIEISDLNDLKDYLVPLLVDSRAGDCLDALSKLMSFSAPAGDRL